MSSRERPREVFPEAPGWPQRLRDLAHVDQPPASLWVWGELPSQAVPWVAVVGSRRASQAGLAVARDIGFELAAAGVVVVSGMARGIDAAAHRGALGAGPTVAVLGCGIELCYPPEHGALRGAIIAAGCVVSEDAGLAAPLGWRFPRRNRLIAALAEAVVVVEATARSGALSTARWAADLGREVLAVPGCIRNPTAAGTNLLIRDGVRPYLGFDDLVDAIPAIAGGGPRGGRVAADLPGPPALPVAPEAEAPLLARVLERVGVDPVHPDELASTLRVASAELAAALTVLQLRGAIVEVCGGRVARTV